MKDKMKLKRVIPILAVACVVICAAVVVFSNVGQAGYYVTVGKTAHGTITADRKRAEASDVVTLNCTADEGYELKEVSVNGKVLEDMSFEMPEENVLIEAKFSVLNKTKGKTEAYEGEAPGAISYDAVYPSGDAHMASWNLVYEEDALVATAWIEGEISNGNGALLNLAKEELSETPDVYQIFCEYQKENDVTSPKVVVKRLDEEGVMQETSADDVAASVIDWEENGKTVGYQATLKVKYSMLGYSGKASAKSSLVVLVGNRARVLPNTIAEFWLDGEYDSENYLSYPRLVDDNTLQKNKFIDMTEMELESYRDIGVILDGEISKGEYVGATLEDATENHRLWAQGQLTRGGNVRLALIIESNTAFDQLVNAYPGVGQYLFAEIGLGNNDGQTCTLIKANVQGEVENAISTVKIVENKNSDYKHKAIMELWIPKSSISDNISSNFVRLSRLALFSGNQGKNSKPDNIFLVARWADINNCNLTTGGIQLEDAVVPPASEIKGMDGVLTDGEYKGVVLEQKTKTHRMTARGYLTKGKNIRFALKIDANTEPNQIINDFPTLGKYLFVESAFGHNTGEKNCTLVKANVLGQAAYATAVAKTTDNGKNAKYRYTTVIEMWIPSSAITNNKTPDNVPITRLALFAGNVEGNDKPDNLFLVAKWVEMNNCSITADGICWPEPESKPESEPEEEKIPEVKVPKSESDGFDGVISNGEYNGKTLEASTGEHKISVQGYITKGKNVRLALTIDAKTAPKKVVNSYPNLSQYLFAEIGLGNNDGQTCTMIKANVLGDAENAAAIAKTKDNGKNAKYRYTTVVEVWIPKASITNNTDSDKVELTRLALFSGNHGEDSTPDNIFLVAKWAKINESTITADGIKLKGQLEVPESESAGFDGKITDGEYNGVVIEKASANYKASVRGHLTEGQNIRLGVEIHSKHKPEKVLNNYPELCQYLFAEFAFGDNKGDESTNKLVQANVLGDAKNAVTKVETTDQGDGNEYRYTTVVEMWIPSSAITNNTTPDKVAITRMGLFHDLDTEDADANWVIAKWAGIQECYLTADGIRKVNTLVVPEAEKDGLDGEIKDGEYKGIILDSTKGSSTSIDYRLTVQGYLNEANNIRLGATIYSSRNPEEDVNPIKLWSKKLFGEFGFGNNNGETCTKVYADALGDAENAVTVVKTTDLGEGIEQRYKTVIEMWIPKEVAGENPTPNMVQFTRAALFHQNYANPETVNETWLVLRSAWNNGGMNNCYVTKEGIVETHLLAGMDGIIQDGEYAGAIINSSHTNETNYKVTMQGFMQGTEKYKHSIRLALKIDATTAPEENVNPATQFSEKLYADLAFGDVDGSGERIMVFADVLGNAQNAVTVVKTTDNGESAQYRYTTVIEMWIPQTAISVESHDDLIWIPRFGLYHQNIEGDPENWVVAKWAYLHNWLRLRTYGLEE